MPESADKQSKTTASAKRAPARGFDALSRTAVIGDHGVRLAFRAKMVPGRNIPAHPNAVHGIHDFDEDTVQWADRVTNTFRAGKYLLAQHTRFGATGEQQVVYYVAYDTLEKENEFIVGPDSLDTFVARYAGGARLTAGSSNTDVLEKTSQPDTTQLRAAPDAYPWVDLHYIPLRLPRGTSGIKFNLEIYLMTPYVRQSAEGELQILYYTAYNMERRRNEFVVGPKWLEFFKQHERACFAIAQLSYPILGTELAPYQIESARYLLGQFRGDPELAAREADAWKAAVKDPFWWLQMLDALQPRPVPASPRLPHTPGVAKPRPRPQQRLSTHPDISDGVPQYIPSDKSSGAIPTPIYDDVSKHIPAAPKGTRPSGVPQPIYDNPYPEVHPADRPFAPSPFRRMEDGYQPGVAHISSGNGGGPKDGPTFGPGHTDVDPAMFGAEPTFDPRVGPEPVSAPTALVKATHSDKRPERVKVLQPDGTMADLSPPKRRRPREHYPKEREAVRKARDKGRQQDLERRGQSGEIEARPVQDLPGSQEEKVIVAPDEGDFADIPTLERIPDDDL